jgi:hypothetical protein
LKSFELLDTNVLSVDSSFSYCFIPMEFGLSNSYLIAGEAIKHDNAIDSVKLLKSKMFNFWQSIKSNTKIKIIESIFFSGLFQQHVFFSRFV